MTIERFERAFRTLDHLYLLAQVESTEDRLVAIATDHRGIEFQAALDQRRVRLAERNKPPVVVEHRCLDMVLRVDRQLPVLGRDRQPRFAAGETGALLVLGPDHRRAAAITALEIGPELNSIRILQVLEGQLGFGQTEFLALVETDRTAQRHDQSGEQPQVAVPVIDMIAPAGGVADDVMVGEGPAGPAFRCRRHEIRHHGPDAINAQPCVGQELEGIAHVHLVAAGGVVGRRSAARSGIAHLAHRCGAGILVISARNRLRNSRFSGWFLS
jgi:hypothetical protein